jgi:hypothetical protein
MAKKVLQILMFLTVVGMLSGFSFADQVSLGESNLGNVQFANNGGTTRMSFTATCGVNPDCISGFGLLGSDVGTYQIWITGVNPKLDPPNAFDIYPVDMTGSTINFSFTLFMGLGNLTGTINAQTITGGSIAPELIGTFTTTSSSGAFVPDWVAGLTTDTDFTVSLAHQTMLLDQVFVTPGSSTSGPLSSGEILPQVPEPSTLGLLGSGLLAMAGVLKRRLL